jgi:hypothetical protein
LFAPLWLAHPVSTAAISTATALASVLTAEGGAGMLTAVRRAELLAGSATESARSGTEKDIW